MQGFYTEASESIEVSSGATTAINSGGDYAVQVGGDSINNGDEIHGNSGYSANPDPVLELPEYKHPPTKPEKGQVSPVERVGALIVYEWILEIFIHPTYSWGEYCISIFSSHSAQMTCGEKVCKNVSSERAVCFPCMTDQC